MPINTETLNKQLYKRLSKYKSKPLDAEGNVTPVEDEADVFKFTFSKDGKDYGTVFATIDDNHALTGAPNDVWLNISKITDLNDKKNFVAMQEGVKRTINWQKNSLYNV
jgi:hypothetical protein